MAHKRTKPTNLSESALVILTGLMLTSLAACSGGSGSSSGVAPLTLTIPPSMARPPMTSDPAQPRWFQIINANTLTSQTPMVLNVAGASLNGGTQLILWPQQNNAANELWEFTETDSSGGTSYGQFVSALGDYPYNPFTNSNNPAQPMTLSASGNEAVVFPSQAVTQEGGGDEFQLWSYQPYCTAKSCNPTSIVNQLTGTSVYVSSTSQDTPVTLQSGAANQWAYWPARQLQDIISEPNNPYTPYSGDLLTQYYYISCNCGDTGLACVDNIPTASPCTLDGQSVNGIRCEYINTAAPLSIYASAIQNLQPASGATSQQIADFNQVKTELVTELTNADTVQNLYANYAAFYNSLFANNEALLDQMISDAGLSVSSSDKVSGRTLDIIAGVLKTAATVAGAVTTGGLSLGINAIADITETAVSLAVQSGTVSENPFQIAVSDLWSTLSSDFTNILSADGANEMTILEDGGRASQVSTLITSSGPDSLAWYPADIDMVTKLEPGFEVAAMKMLMPAKYNIQVTRQNNTGEFTGSSSVPSWDQYVNGLGYGVWDEFYIGSLGSTNEYPSKQAMQSDILNNGVNPIQLFNNFNGWNFSYNYDYSAWSEVGASGCNSLLVSITNQTADTLSIAASVAAYDGYLFGSSPRTLGPYATNIFGVQGEGLHGPDFDFDITGSNGSASFEVQQDYCFTQAGDIHYSNQDTSGKYQLTNAGSTTGSEAHDIPGIQRVAVYNPDANQ